MAYRVQYGMSNASLPYQELLQRVAQRLGAETSEASARSAALKQREYEQIGGSIETIARQQFLRNLQREQEQARLQAEEMQQEGMLRREQMQQQGATERLQANQGLEVLDEQGRAAVMGHYMDISKIQSDDSLRPEEKEAAMAETYEKIRNEYRIAAVKPKPPTFQEQAQQAMATVETPFGPMVAVQEAPGRTGWMTAKDFAQGGGAKEQMGPLGEALGISDPKELLAVRELFNDRLEELRSTEGVLSPARVDQLAKEFIDEQSALNRAVNGTPPVGPPVAPPSMGAPFPAGPPGANGQVSAQDLAVPGGQEVFAQPDGPAPIPKFSPGTPYRGGEQVLLAGEVYEVVVVAGEIRLRKVHR